MAENQELTSTEKQELDTSAHQELRSGYWFVPATDIYEMPDKVVLVMDMAGVCYDCAHVNIVDDELGEMRRDWPENEIVRWINLLETGQESFAKPQSP